MTLCYLYNKTISYTHIDALLACFDESERIEFNTSICEKEHAVYIVDAGELTKDQASLLRAFFSSRSNVLIFFILPKRPGAAFYQLAYLLKVKSIISPTQDAVSVSSLIKNAYATFMQETKSLFVGSFVSEVLCYMIFKNKKLHYASETLLKNFQCTSLEELESKICVKLPVDELLQTKNQTIINGSFFDKEKLDIVRSINKKEEHLIILERFAFADLHCSKEETLSTRLKLIDFLKERLANEKEKSYIAIAIKIVNFKKISHLIGKSELEEFIQTLVQKTKLLLQDYLVFSEYYPDFFVTLYKDKSFEDVERHAEKIYKELESFTERFAFKVEIALHVLRIDALDLGTVLTLFDAIRNNSLSKKEIQERNVRYISRYKKDMSDKEIVSLLLNDSYINDSDIKLVNIYKGMIIDSPTKIIKREHNAIYVIVKQIQGAVLSLQKETYIHSDAFEKEIKAKVVFVDRKRKLAKLTNFKVVDYDMSRLQENSRVDFAKKTKAVLSLTGTKVSAEILDISANSIRLKLGKIKMIDRLLEKKIEINFVLPTKRTREKEIQIHDTVRVISIQKQEDATLIVCEFDPGSQYRRFILEYVHTRQIEIVEELKKLVY